METFEIPSVPPRYKGEPIEYRAVKNVVEKAKRIFSKGDRITIEDYDGLEKEKQQKFEPVYLADPEEVSSSW